MLEDLVNELSQKLGIVSEFFDVTTGFNHQTEFDTKQELAALLGYPAFTEEEAAESLKKLQQITERIPSFMTVRKSALEEGTDVPFFVSEKDQFSVCKVTTEDGFTVSRDITSCLFLGRFETEDQGVLLKYTFPLCLSLPFGYHQLTWTIGTETYNMELAVAPTETYGSDASEKIWGMPLQLYALKSDENWGIGDFRDLRKTALFLSSEGASLVGVNPLSALFLDAPEEASPYFASHRLFLNPLYIAIEETEEYRDSAEIGEWVYQQKERIQALREAETVQYTEVANLKREAVEKLYSFFKKRHLSEDLQEALTPRGEEFLTFCRRFGKRLDRYAVYQISKLYTGKADDSDAFVTEHVDDVMTLKYAQFVAFEQLKAVQKALEGTGTSLYFDLAVGASRDSAESFGSEELFVPDVSIGAPPDFFNRDGQNWSLAAFHPLRMKKTGYRFLREVLREYMAYAGALRLDHIFSFERLYLKLPSGKGAYLSYPSEDLFNLLALESELNKCMVLGEDLGTPPPLFHYKMHERKVCSFLLFRYQKNGDFFKPSREYLPQSVVATGTHDMPSFPGYWLNTDIDTAVELGKKTPEQASFDKECRLRERQSIFGLLASEGIVFEGIGYEDWAGIRLNPEVIVGVYEFLARSPGKILLIQPEDLMNQTRQTNIPGTHLEYPNWRFKLPENPVNLGENPLFKKILSGEVKKRNKRIDKKVE